MFRGSRRDPCSRYRDRGDNVTKYPYGDGEIEITTEIVSHNVEENTTTVKYSVNLTKPVTVAVFGIGTETGETS